jgi:hypothetical protein
MHSAIHNHVDMSPLLVPIQSPVITVQTFSHRGRWASSYGLPSGRGTGSGMDTVCTTISVTQHLFCNCYYCLIELQMDFTRWQWYYNKTQHVKIHITQNITPRSNKTAHKATQTVKDTLHNMNRMQK